jgi:hypothetical protein
MSTYEDVSQYFVTIGRRVMVGGTYLSRPPATAARGHCGSQLVRVRERTTRERWLARWSGSGAEPHITRNTDRTDGSADKLTGRRARTKRARSRDWRGRQ